MGHVAVHIRKAHGVPGLQIADAAEVPGGQSSKVFHLLLYERVMTK